MSGVPDGHLEALYAATDDPWHFHTSDYEQHRFAAIVDALERPQYAHILELGCGNGALARHLASRAGRYTGLDAVARALEAAQQAVPEARFLHRVLPCSLPPAEGADYDLIVLSEILYFLDQPDLRALAWTLDSEVPGAALLVVNWRGPSGNRLEGEEAFRIFRSATSRLCRAVHIEERFRIDALSPLGWAR